jgi:3',5'-cyclic AMP phosphodiesterase CpdA
MEWGTETYTGEQAQWFEDQLKTISPEEWIIVMSHTFYYSTGSYSSGAQWFDNPKTIATLVPLFDQYDVDLVISGHVHDTQILQNMNTTYIISGAFGGVLEPDPTTQSIAHQVYFNNKDYAHVEIAIADMIANITVVHENGHDLYTTLVYQ